MIYMLYFIVKINKHLNKRSLTTKKALLPYAYFKKENIMFPSAEQLKKHHYNQMIEEFGGVVYQEECGQYILLLCQKEGKATPLVFNNGICFDEVRTCPLNWIENGENGTFIIGLTRKINEGCLRMKIVSRRGKAKVQLKNNLDFYNNLFFNK